MLAGLRTLLSPQRKNEDGSFPTIHIQKGKNPVRLPAKINMALFQPSQITAPATQNRHAFHSRTNKNKHHSPKKTDKTSTSPNIKKRKNPSCLPAKIKMVLFQPSQNTAPATQNARAPIHCWPQVKMQFCRSENRENAFRLHEMQISKVMPDHFGDGETQVYLYIPISYNIITIL